MKSERHHWWPLCVSSHWTDSDGTVGWIKPDGSYIRVQPKNLAVIGNGHHIKLRRGEPTPWDSSFEKEFELADNSFSSVITWLSSLRSEVVRALDLRERFVPQTATDEQLQLLTECVVSLAVRSPMNREASVALAEDMRSGRIINPERDVLIGLNMRNSQRVVADTIGARAKFAVLISSGREFIFGDGFFHNIQAVANPPIAPKMVAPITPTVSVAVFRPTSFSTEPRLSTIVLSDAEVEACNHAAQVYSRKALFFRTTKPTIEDVFVRGEHRVYSDPHNPMDNLLSSIPGVPARGGSLELLMRRFPSRD